ncbi:hypothetical protein [Helicobacter sp. 13S00401-1]|uniref:hypothetical protein n=1 Tax=Helicobacter sp. 13S00401-1 TaxID=1905758 RepID=UPI001557C891|nr:hypothetical protein [Helicobacter sp. 13S00401-1]
MKPILYAVILSVMLVACASKPKASGMDGVFKQTQCSMSCVDGKCKNICVDTTGTFK